MAGIPHESIHGGYKATEITCTRATLHGFCENGDAAHFTNIEIWWNMCFNMFNLSFKYATERKTSSSAIRFFFGTPTRLGIPLVYMSQTWPLTGWTLGWDPFRGLSENRGPRKFSGLRKRIEQNFPRRMSCFFFSGKNSFMVNMVPSFDGNNPFLLIILPFWWKSTSWLPVPSRRHLRKLPGSSFGDGQSIGMI